MTVSHMLFQLLIKPLEVLFEVIYGYAMIRLNNPGLAIIVMSLVMNILLLPLYRRADLIQEEERRLEKGRYLFSSPPITFFLIWKTWPAHPSVRFRISVHRITFSRFSVFLFRSCRFL